jgi:alanyl-tRNA synthetase
VTQAAGTLKAPVAELQGPHHQVLDHVKALEKEVAALKGKLASSQGDELVRRPWTSRASRCWPCKLDGADAKTCATPWTSSRTSSRPPSSCWPPWTATRCRLAAGVTADSVGKVKAGELVNFVAQQVGGKGGGKPDMAMAGGTDA